MATEINENITVADLAYAAGVMDSDGCITLTRYPTTAGNWTYPITVCVSMIDEVVPLWFAATFGGKVKVSKRKNPKYSDLYLWRLYCRNAAEFLQMIQPYLILKKDRAGLAIKLALMSRKRGGGQGWRFGQAVLTEKELSDRLEIATQLRQANSSANSRVKFTSKWGKEDR